MVKEAATNECGADRIGHLTSSRLYTSRQTPVPVLLERIKETGRQAIGVLNTDNSVAGVIDPEHLLGILGKPFGRDLLHRQKAEDIMQQVKSFHDDEYIREILDRTHCDLEKDSLTHYILVDTADTFKGIVTTQDLLMYALREHQRELQLAETIQGRLVQPSIAIDDGTVALVCSSVMARGVGGDFYSVRNIDSNRWFFCLCDISGKGISAALVTAVLSGFLDNEQFIDPLDIILKRLNRTLLDTFKLEKFLTGMFARFDARTGLLEYCDMGHSYFFTLQDGMTQQISKEADNMPLGLIAEIPVTTRALRLEPGTVLAVVSDGIMEQKNRAGMVFPMDKLGKAVPVNPSGKRDLLKAKISILETFFSFKKDIPQHDDISLLLFHYLRTPA